MRIFAAVFIPIFFLFEVLSQEPSEKKKPLQLIIKAEKAKYMVGEFIQVEVQLKNVSKEPVEILDLVFEERSLSFDIEIINKKTSPPTTTRYTFSRTLPEGFIAHRVPPSKINLQPQKQIRRYFLIPAILSGDVSITAKYKGLLKEDISSQPAKLEIKERKGEPVLGVTLVISQKGSINIKLFPESVPNAVSHFLCLVRMGFYNNLKFYRVVKNKWIQIGCPYNIGYGGPGYSVKSEIKIAKYKEVVKGSVAFCRYENVQYIGSMFFMSNARIRYLDKKVVIFGKVIGEPGFKLLQELVNVEVEEDERPKEDIFLEKITITTFPKGE
jgi:peptidyl-prolyl cis-trans isomerase B (cyclophilin B)